MFFGILRLWVLLHLANGSLGCWEGERIALLKLKDSFNYPNGTALSSWGDKEEKDCCKWEKVSCSESTKRVTKLFLNRTRPLELRRIVDFSLETSLFLPFEELQELRLDSNGITGFNGVQKLNKLKMLDLSFNQLTEILSLSGLESLKI
ncbi:hypothetical protein A4A49_16553 [Nicotiana attenuata]|uniref:Leucine-rich repeat-containing N-terminal plant-type domain-containing protein n=1 Tax=Nicotiana attenuata TaxID=49451 RepID=A0A314KZT7_NICAT|nr:hypothetical protein A4A49_16553 [Nicotiana attenuata]